MIRSRHINVLISSKRASHKAFFIRPLASRLTSRSRYIPKTMIVSRRRAEFEPDDKRYFGHFAARGIIRAVLTGICVLMLVRYAIDRATRREKRTRKNDSEIPRVLDRNDIYVSFSRCTPGITPVRCG